MMKKYLGLRSIRFAKISLIFFTIMWSFAVSAEHIKCSDIFDFHDLPELRVQSRNFNTGRNLKSYQEFFKAEKFEFPIYKKTLSNGRFNLLEKLMSLEPSDIYLNIGSGQGLAEQDLIKKTDFKGKIIGVDLAEFSAQMLKISLQNNGRLKFEGGKTLEQLDVSGKLSTLLPEGAALITDLYASDTYSHQLDQSIRIKLQHLKPGGILATLIPTESYGFNFKNVKVGTRIRPVSKTALEYTQLSNRVLDYLKMQGFQTQDILQKLANLSVEPFPSIYNEQIESVCCGEELDEKTAVLLSRDFSISFMKSQIVGMLGWIEAFRGVEIIALSGIPSSGGESGILLVLQRTTQPLYIAPLKLEDYKFDVGPSTRLYSW